MRVDNSHTMKASELKGRRLMKNTVTGETVFDPVEPDAVELKLPGPEVSPVKMPVQPNPEVPPRGTMVKMPVQPNPEVPPVPMPTKGRKKRGA